MESRVAESTHRLAGRLDFASWLTDDILLLVGWCAGSGEFTGCTLRKGGSELKLEARICSYPRIDNPCDDPVSGRVITVRLLKKPRAEEELGQLQVHFGEKRLALGPEDLAGALNSLPVLLRGSLAALSGDARGRVLDFLATTLAGHAGTSNPRRLSKSLLQIRDELRVRAPICSISPSVPQGLSVDALFSVSPTSFYMRGWAHDAEAELTSLTVTSPSGERIELDRSFRFSRPDIEKLYETAPTHFVEKHGFIATFETTVPHFVPNGWILEMHNADGQVCETSAPRTVDEPKTVRDAILSDLLFDPAPGCTLLTEHVGPALTKLQECRRSAEISAVDQYGELVEEPEVSIVVPLYKRIDFLEQQLAQFVHDPEMHRVDLIYVLDSPELAASLRVAAGQLHDLYGIPFRVAYLCANSGYSAANNAGASLARGKLLLLLNSDILPDQPGWLSGLTRFYNQTPGIGALGPKLLFEDDTLQHAGMYFVRDEATAIWDTMHYYKGMHRTIPAANDPRVVPAVTGACMMISRALYEEMDGLRGTYIHGDCEDSELCLRLLEAGHESWYLPSVELYHLEGQSYPMPLRQATSRFNRWQHTQLWGSVIEEVMKVHSPRATRIGVKAKRAEGRNAPVARPAAAKRVKRTTLEEPARNGNDPAKAAGEVVDLFLQTCAVASDAPTNGARRWITSSSGAVMSEPLSTGVHEPTTSSNGEHKPGRADPNNGSSDKAAILVRCVEELRREAGRREQTIAELQKTIALAERKFHDAAAEIAQRDESRVNQVLERVGQGHESVRQEIGVLSAALHEQRGEIGKLDPLSERLSRLEGVLDGTLQKVERKSADLFRATLVAEVQRVAREVIPAGAIVAVVSKGDAEIVNLEGRTGWHFPQTDAGLYAGHHPAESGAALSQLEAVRRRGAEFLLFPRSAFWWFEHYPEFKQQLDTEFRVISSDPWCVIYRLSEASGEPAVYDGNWLRRWVTRPVLPA